MPMDRKLYPPNWDAIASGIKTEVNWCCEFCGRACIRPGESVEEFCDRIRTTDNPEECPVVADFRAFPRRWLMTVAHLNHIPADCDGYDTGLRGKRTNLKALCNPCHCRYDLQQMGRKQLLKRERHGQLRIDGL
jgi:hypothetical protein